MRSPTEKDKFWPKAKDPLADWDKAAGQAGFADAEREGMEELMARKGGRYVEDSKSRGRTVNTDPANRDRHIRSKNAQTGAAITDLTGQGYSTGEATRLIDPKRGSRARGLNND